MNACRLEQVYYQPFFIIYKSNRRWTKKKKAIYLLLIGLLFHYSALLLFPFLFFSNEPLNKKGRLYWGTAILIAYIIAILGFAVLFSTNLDIPYIGNKLAIYQKAQEKEWLIQASISLVH